MKKAIKTVIIITIITFMSKIIGFSRELCLTYFYGGSSITDEFLLAINIASLCMSWLTTMAVAHTPIYNEIRNKSKELAEKYTNVLIVFIILLGFVICIGLIINSNIIIEFVTVGIIRDNVDNIRLIFGFTVIGLTIFAINKIIISELNCNDKIIFTTMSELSYSLTLIVCVIISGLMKNPIYLYCSYLLAAFFQLLILLFYFCLSKRNFSLKNFIERKKIIFDTLNFVKYNILSNLTIDFNNFVDKTFATLLSIGGVSALNYGNIICITIHNIISVPIGTYLYPKLNKYLKSNDISNFTSLISLIFKMLSIVLIPITIFLMMFSTEIVKILFYRGEFDIGMVNLTSKTLFMYTIYILPTSISYIYFIVFNSFKFPNMNLICGLFTVVFNIFFNLITYKEMGVSGIAFSTAISTIFGVIICNVIYKRKIDKNSNLLPIKAIIFCTLLSFAILIICNTIIDINNMNILTIFIKGFFYFSIYFAIICLSDKQIKSIVFYFFKKKKF